MDGRAARAVALLTVIVVGASACDQATPPSLGDMANGAPPVPRPLSSNAPRSTPVIGAAPTMLAGTVSRPDSRPWTGPAPKVPSRTRTVGTAAASQVAASPSPSILFEDLATGARGFYTMNGSTLGAWNPIATIPPELRMVGSGDFTGDNQTDLVFENSRDGSRWVLQLSSSSAPVSWFSIGTIPTEWHIAGIASLTHAATPDVLWQDALTGEVGLYRMNRTTVQGWTPIGTVSPDLRMVAAGDFTGDGQTDLIFENLRDGTRWVLQMNGVVAVQWVAIGPVSTELRIRGAGDFTGDGQMDLLFENTRDGSRWILRMSGASAQAWIALTTLSTSWHITGSDSRLSGAPTTGTLRVTITGLPAGAPANVRVTGSNFSATINSSSSLPSLAPGTYTISASTVSFGGTIYTPTPASRTAGVTAGATTDGAVVFSPPAPDLVMDVVTTPATATSGGTMTVSVTARNQGTAASGTFRVGYYFSTDTTITGADVLFASCTFGTGLPANGAGDCSGSVTVPSSLPPGTYYVGAFVDDLGQVSESNESNNARSAATTTVVSSSIALPDFLLDAVTAPATGTIGGTISASATVRNNGAATTSGFRIGFYYSTDPTITTADAFSGTSCTYSGGLAANISNVCSGQITVPSTLAPGTYYVGAIADDLAQRNETSETNNARAASAATVLSGTSPGLNLIIDGMYLTQATQTYAGTVPLVAGRAGVLRVFVKATQTNSAAPAVRVRLYQNGSLVDTRTIPAPATSVPTSINEGSLASSWNLSLAGTVIKPGLTILADVDPTNTVSETSETDNSFPVNGTPQALDVRTVSTYNVMLVPVVQTPNGLQGDVTEANKATYMDFANRVYPLATYNATIHAAYMYDSVLSSSYDGSWETLLSRIDALRLAEGSSQSFYGVFKPAFTSGGTGLGQIGGKAAVGVDLTSAVSGSSTTYRSMTAAHEWGHNFGRRHVDCGGPSDPDPFYPYATNTIGTYGYDLSTNQVVPTTFVDLMSYCSPVFVSDYTYTGVLDDRASQSGPSFSTASQHSLLVSGHIGPNGVVLEPAFEIDAPPSLPTRAGPYRLQAIDDAGGEVFNLSFQGDVVDHMPDERLFTFVIPLGANGRTLSALRLVANGREAIRRRTVPASPVGNVPASLASARLTPSTGSRSRFEWDAATYPMVLIRDPATGQVLSFARGGQVDLALSSRDLDVTFSDGVGSVRRRVSITPR